MIDTIHGPHSSAIIYSIAETEGAKFMVVLIGLVIIFKSQLTSLVQTIFEKITSESSGI